MTEKRGPGRRKVKAKRDNILRVRLTDAERASIDAAVDRAEMELSEWCRKVLLEKARPMAYKMVEPEPGTEWPEHWDADRLKAELEKRGSAGFRDEFQNQTVKPDVDKLLAAIPGLTKGVNPDRKVVGGYSEDEEEQE